jgi:hypothetical protein
MKKTTTLALLPLTALAVTALSGCAVLDDLRHESGADFATVAELDAGWDKSVPWLPADATGIRTREATNGDSAILKATTDTELDSAKCAEIDRQSAPVYEQDWSPNAFVDSAWVCGDWTVIPTDDGWYGWTPNDPDEKALSPVG